MTEEAHRPWPSFQPFTERIPIGRRSRGRSGEFDSADAHDVSRPWRIFGPYPDRHWGGVARTIGGRLFLMGG